MTRRKENSSFSDIDTVLALICLDFAMEYDIVWHVCALSDPLETCLVGVAGLSCFASQGSPTTL